MATKRLSVGRRGFLKSAVALVATAQAAAPSRATAQDSPTTANQNWLALTRETALEPQLPIIDPHHHFWDVPDRTPDRYFSRSSSRTPKGTTCVRRCSSSAGRCIVPTVPKSSGLSAKPSSYRALRQRAPAGDMAICAPPQASSVRQICGWVTASRPCSRPRSQQARSAVPTDILHFPARVLVTPVGRSPSSSRS